MFKKKIVSLKNKIVKIAKNIFKSNSTKRNDIIASESRSISNPNISDTFSAGIVALGVTVTTSALANKPNYVIVQEQSDNIIHDKNQNSLNSDTVDVDQESTGQIILELGFGDKLLLSKKPITAEQSKQYQKMISDMLGPELSEKYYGAEPQPSKIDKSSTMISKIIEIPNGGDLGKSGPGARARWDATRNGRKTGGSMFVEGFTPHPYYGSRPNHPINKPLSVRKAEINDGQYNRNENLGGPSSCMEQMSKRLSPEYREYQQKFNSPPVSKRFDTEQYDQEKFQELSKDPRANKEVFHKTTVDEARAAIQSEMEEIVDNPQRIEKPFCKSVDLDFKVDGPAPYTHMDIKHPVGSDILRKQNREVDIKTMAYDMGKKIVRQKERFCELDQGPKSSKNVLHIVDMSYVRPDEKGIVKKYCLKGAGSSEGIQFLNDK